MILEEILKQNVGGSRKLSFVGGVIGLILVGCTLQFYLDLNSFGSSGGDQNSEYIVIKKEINSLNAIGIGSSDFSEEEIALVRDMKLVLDVASFDYSSFHCYLKLSSEGGQFPPLETLIYFESLPDRFIDADLSQWDWKEGQATVPVILSTSYFDAYNYGLAKALGSPEVSKSLLSSVKCGLEISGQGKNENYQIQIIGFSDRINSIVVPSSFLDYANINFGKEQIRKPNKLIIACEDARNPILIDFLKKNEFVSNEEQQRGISGTSTLELVSAILIFLGVVVLLLSATVIFQNIRILMSASQSSIAKLLLIGYSPSQILKQVMRAVNKQLLLMLLMGFIGVVVIKTLVTSLIFHFMAQFAGPAEGESFNSNMSWIIAWQVSVVLIVVGFVVWKVSREVASRTLKQLTES